MGTKSCRAIQSALALAALVSLSACDRSTTAPSPLPSPGAGGPPSAPPVTAALAAEPAVTAVTPAIIVAGSATRVTLTGSAFIGGATTVTVSGSGVAATDVEVTDATSIAVRLTVDRAADIGPRSISVATSDGTATASLTINPATPAVTGMSLTTIRAGDTVDVTVAGTGFVPNQTTASVTGGGVTVVSSSVSGAVSKAQDDDVSDPLVAGTGTSLIVRLAVDANANPGPRSLIVTTPGGPSSAFPFTIAASLPVIVSFRASPLIIVRGSSSTLSWNGISGATRCEINVGVGEVPCRDASVTVTPADTIEYMLSAFGPGGREWIYVTVNVEGPPPPPPPTPPGSQSFSASGAAQTFTVPPGITQITIEAYGAAGERGQDHPGFFGGATAIGGAGGLGGYVRATLSVIPNSQLLVQVGGPGQATGIRGDGGGGGGMSDVRVAPYGLADRVVVAGGGGGGAGGGQELHTVCDPMFGCTNFDSPVHGRDGGGGGGAAGAAGGMPRGGGGGTASAGGAAGVGPIPATATGGFGIGGSMSGGGAGGVNGGGRAEDGNGGGGGGGAGWYGGGAGDGNGGGAGGGGGGGSSFTIPGATNIVHQQGVRSGNGLIVIRW